MRNGWGVMTGLGMAAVLIAATPAWAGGDKAGSMGSTSDPSASGSTSSDTSRSGSASGSVGSGSTMGTSPDATHGTASGSTASDPSASAMGSSASTNEVTGKVEKFDRSNKELTLSLKVSDTTQVTKDGQTASLSDIKEGDQIRASFSGSGETLEVTQIEVMSKGSKSSTGTGSSGYGSDSPSGSTGTDTGSTGSKSGGSSGRGY